MRLKHRLSQLFVMWFLGYTTACLDAQNCASTPSFEVATVKLTDQSREFARGVFVMPGGKVVASGSTLSELVAYAYDLQFYQVTNAHGWMKDLQYDVAGVPPDSSPERKARPSSLKEPLSAAQRDMLANLLCDRFRLQVSSHQADGKVLALTRLKQSNLLRPSDDPSKVPYAIVITTSDGKGNGEIRAENTSMEYLASRLSRYLGETVIDKTGLKGQFDFTVPPLDSSNADERDAILEGVKRLGLQLVATRGQISTIKIETAQKASGN